MADALEILSNLKSLDLDGIIHQTLVDNEKVMADLNAVQMSKGLRSDGSEILPSYADLTIELKEGKPGLAGVTDRVTLFDTGDHYRELYAEVQGADAIEYGSKDEKSEKLQKKYGDKIYGLDSDSRDELAEQHLRPSYMTAVEQHTGLTFNK
jgi:hypothetical protein